MEYIRSAEAASPRATTSRSRTTRARPRGDRRRGSARVVPGCLFCGVPRSGAEREHLVLARRPRAFLMLNRFPYSPGHLMVAVVRHAAQFQDLDHEERFDLLELTALAERALAVEYRPHGMNYGLNVGKIAGAGFPGHLHLHLVPRWNGDTNFMPTVAETRVLPEALGRTWMRLRGAVRSLESGRARAPR
jgi:ATP adenylyltransferase